MANNNTAAAPPTTTTTATTTTTTPPPLPPPDEETRELERLLELAKVGTHELLTDDELSVEPPEQTDIPPEAAWDRPNLEQEEKEGTMEAENVLSDDTMETGEATATTPTTANKKESDQYAVETVTDEEPTTTQHDKNNNTAVQFRTTEYQEELTPPPPSDDPNSNVVESHDLVIVETTDEEEDDNDAEETQNPQQQTLTVFAPSQFNFLSDDTAVQLDTLKQLSRNHSHAFYTHIHDLECHVAALTAQLAQERMDRNLSFASLLESAVYKPLEAAFERLTLDRCYQMNHHCGAFATTDPQQQQEPHGDATNTTTLNTKWMDLEKRATRLDAQLVYLRTVDVPDAHKEWLEPHREQLESKQHELSVERLQCDKKYLSVCRKWESVAGSWQRRYQQAVAERVSSSARLDRFNPQNERSSTNTDAWLDAIESVRRELAVERTERRRQDEQLYQHITQTTNEMQHGILRAFDE